MPYVLTFVGGLIAGGVITRLYYSKAITFLKTEEDKIKAKIKGY